MWQILLPVVALVLLPLLVGAWHVRAKNASAKRTAAMLDRLRPCRSLPPWYAKREN